MNRTHIENMMGAALGLLGVIAAPLLAADDWMTKDWVTKDWVADDWASTLPILMLDALIWGAGALVLYLYGVRGTGGDRW